MAFIKTTAPKTLTFEEALKLIKPLRLKEPSQRIARELSELKKLRRVNLDFLGPIKELCSWCEKKKLPSKRHKYCSVVCRESAHTYCNPSLDAMKGHILLFKQNCACVGCGLSFENEVKRRVENRIKNNLEANEYIKNGTDILNRKKLLPMSGFPPSLAVYDTGHLMQVDHIIPIHHGGDGLGWHNIQVLCTDCHTKKTITERKRSK